MLTKYLSATPIIYGTKGRRPLHTREDEMRAVEAPGFHDLAEALGGSDADAILSELAAASALDRHDLAEKSLHEMRTREAEAIKLLGHVDRDLRNLLRMLRRLHEERGSLATTVSRLHKAIRAMEASLSDDAHRDHMVDLAHKGLVQFVADETWRMDNRKDWEFEETPPDEDHDCPISEVTQPRAANRRPLRLIGREHPKADAG